MSSRKDRYEEADAAGDDPYGYKEAARKKEARKEARKDRYLEVARYAADAAGDDPYGYEEAARKKEARKDRYLEVARYAAAQARHPDPSSLVHAVAIQQSAAQVQRRRQRYASTWTARRADSRGETIDRSRGSADSMTKEHRLTDAYDDYLELISDGPSSSPIGLLSAPYKMGRWRTLLQSVKTLVDFEASQIKPVQTSIDILKINLAPLIFEPLKEWYRLKGLNSTFGQYPSKANKLPGWALFDNVRRQYFTAGGLDAPAAAVKLQEKLVKEQREQRESAGILNMIKIERTAYEKAVRLSNPDATHIWRTGGET
jgi:hypothetical protein